MVRVYYSSKYVSSGHAFDTTRKAKWIADSLADSPISGIELVEPGPLTRDYIAEVHAAEYVRAVETGVPRSLAESQGFTWDGGLWPAVVSTTSGMISAALAALEDGVAGSLSTGLHHAKNGRGAGFCTFNGLVMAAKAALARGAKSVLILDLDAHCGGGTSSMIANEPGIRHLDVSVDNYDSYASDERSRLLIVRTGSQYLDAIRWVLEEADRRGEEFDLCLYNAGMDPSEDCAIGGLVGVTPDILAERERLVFEWCRVRRLAVAFAIAGGYIGPNLDQQGLVSLHQLTLLTASTA